MSEGVAEAITDAATALDVPIGEREATQLAHLVGELLRWNARIRLVGPDNAREIIDAHIADALGTLRLVRTLQVPAWYDIGSGAGLPGLVLAICLPQIQFVLVEPIAKKAAFISHIKRELGLDNASVRVCRMEALEPGGPTAALSRATFAPDAWFARAAALVGPGGAVMVCLGSKDAPALRAAAVSVDDYALPGSGAVRTNLLLRVPH